MEASLRRFLVSFVYIKRSRLPFTGITPPHMCACPNPEPGFPKSCCAQRVKMRVDCSFC
jgi:hypothetical protein